MKENDMTDHGLRRTTTAGVNDAALGPALRILNGQELSSARDDSRFFGLDWISKAENFEKILELKYHGGDA
jgi:hypothetical protein